MSSSPACRASCRCARNCANGYPRIVHFVEEVLVKSTPAISWPGQRAARARRLIFSRRSVHAQRSGRRGRGVGDATDGGDARRRRRRMRRPRSARPAAWSPVGTDDDDDGGADVDRRARRRRWRRRRCRTTSTRPDEVQAATATSRDRRAGLGSTVDPQVGRVGQALRLQLRLRVQLAPHRLPGVVRRSGCHSCVPACRPSTR